MLDPLEDRRLVKALLAHDSAAFTEFFDGYFPRLFRFATARMGGDSESSRDVVQRTLIKAVRKLHTYRGEAALFTWLCAICRNEISDFLHAHAVEQERVVLIEDYSEVRAAVDALSAPSVDTPEEQFRRLEVRRFIEVASDQLPAHYGNALEWKYVYGFTQEEIAKRLGLTMEATNSVLARARRAFKEGYQTLISGMDEVLERGMNGESS